CAVRRVRSNWCVLINFPYLIPIDFSTADLKDSLTTGFVSRVDNLERSESVDVEDMQGPFKADWDVGRGGIVEDVFDIVGREESAQVALGLGNVGEFKMSVFVDKLPSPAF